MSLRNKISAAMTATKESAATQWRDFLGLDWKWALAYLAFVPFYVGLYFIAQLINAG
jgi:hypothetical protein